MVIIKVGNHANKIIIMVGLIISFIVVPVTRAPRYKRGAVGGVMFAIPRLTPGTAAK